MVWEYHPQSYSPLRPLFLYIYRRVIKMARFGLFLESLRYHIIYLVTKVVVKSDVILAMDHHLMVQQ